MWVIDFIDFDGVASAEAFDDYYEALFMYDRISADSARATLSEYPTREAVEADRIILRTKGS